MGDLLIQQVESNISSFESKLEAIISSIKSTLAQEERTFLSQATTDTESIKKLKQTIKQRREAAEQLQRILEIETQEEDAAQRVVDQLSKQLLDAPAAVDAIEQRLRKQQALCEERSEALERVESSKKQYSTEIARGLAFYKDRLGLEFESLPNSRLRIIFTLVDPEHPSREFSFVIFVNQDHQYVFESCNPPVEGTDVLLATLNKTNNLAAFVQAMRRKFKALVV